MSIAPAQKFLKPIRFFGIPIPFSEKIWAHFRLLSMVTSVNIKLDNSKELTEMNID